MSILGPEASARSAVGGPQARLPEGTEMLGPFVEAHILDEAAVQVAAHLKRTAPSTPDSVLLAAALCVRGLAHGHVCVEIASAPETTVADNTTEGDSESAAEAAQSIDPAPPEWPEQAVWAEDLRSSELVALVDPVEARIPDSVLRTGIAPLVFDGTRVYLERYWRYERQVGDSLLAGTGPTPGTDPPTQDRSVPEELLDRYLGPPDDAQGNTNLARRAGSLTNDSRVVVLAGGPGTGKTHTIARLLAATLHGAIDAGRPLRVALAAPTGKAAARMAEAIGQAIEHLDLPAEVAEQLRDAETSTIHRLLGHRDGITFRADHDHPLSHDLVVIDETSMVALPLMARLLDALRTDARLVLVGDPFQLASVEAGSVLADVVGPAAGGGTPPTGVLSSSIVVLEKNHRFAEGSAIAGLATSIRSGDAERAIGILGESDRNNGSGNPEVAWVRPDDEGPLEALRRTIADHAAETVQLATSGTAADALASSNALKVLCGTRFGTFGSRSWQDQIERRLPRGHGHPVPDPWYIGRPVMITRNDPITGVFNGDTGIVMDHDGRLTVALPHGDSIRHIPTSRLTDVTTWWAMTIHKSQGSEFDHVVVSLPDRSSPVLTRELLYTAVTRAKAQLTIVGSGDLIEQAVALPATRASGLGARLWP